MDQRTSKGLLLGISIFFLLFLTCKSHNSPMFKPDSMPDYKFTKYLDKDLTFFVKWMVNETHIIFEVQAKTLGWAGLGFSPHGGMHGADIVVMWINNGHIFIEDRYAEGDFEPLKDEQQDWIAIYGRENETHTIIGMTRLLDTCDKHDRPITHDTIRLIYAYHTNDIINGVMPKHEVRGTKNFFFYEPIPEFVVPHYTKKMTFRVDENNVPGDRDTLYLCQIMPIKGIDKKYHIIASTAVITPGNENYVHHMDIYLCQDKYAFTPIQFDCNKPGIETLKMKCFYTVLVSWTVGAEGYLFPDDVGHPFDQNMENRFIMLEIHYNNPNLIKGIVDNSGLEIYLTDNLREKEAGNLVFGYLAYDWTMTIPPMQKDFTFMTECSAGCLGKHMPNSGISIFAYILHTHLIGVKVAVKIIRSGREMKPVMFDDQYIFNYQAKRRLSTHIKVYPGDTIITECVYSSENKENYTFGGESSRDEMCIVEVAYYPRISIMGCGSTVDKSIIAPVLGIDEKNETQMGNSFVPNYLNQNEYKSPQSQKLHQIATKLQNIYFNGPWMKLCSLEQASESSDSTTSLVDYSIYYKRYNTQASQKCSLKDNKSEGLSHSHTLRLTSQPNSAVHFYRPFSFFVTFCLLLSFLCNN